MRARFWISLCVVILAGRASAGTISYSLTALGADSYQYSFFLNGITFSANQGVSLSFDLLKYGTLSNGIASSDFSVLLLQPNNPPGLDGLFSALSLVNNPSLSTPFSVDVVYLLPSGLPGPVPYSIDTYNADGKLISTQDTGTADPTPEPSSLLLGATGVLICMGFLAMRGRRPRGSAQS